jgi:polysaccharide pyruvyl transferase WcaK-like protein
LLNKANYIVARDEKSFLRLKEFDLKNLFNGLDNAFLIKDLLKKDIETDKVEAILNIKEFASASLSSKWIEKKGNQSAKKSDYLKFISAIIDYYRSRGDLKICALPMTIDDEIFIRRYFKDKVDYIYKYTGDFNKISSIISSAKEVFSTRYHFHLLSLINKKTIICYAYADKVENINDEIASFKYITTGDIINFGKINFNDYLNNYSEYENGLEEYMIKLKSEIKLLDELI